jgi:cobalt/nickel transport system permease protein
VHHVVLERWSRGDSFLHRRDARAKLIAALVFLVLLATTRDRLAFVAPLYACALLAGLAGARLPMAGALARAAAVLPFSAVFAFSSWLAGDPQRAAELVVKSYLSALAVLLLVGCTRLPDLLRALELLGAPRFLLVVAQFLYRYLFIISEQAQHMRLAGISRGGFRRAGFRAAAGALGVLFARSYVRAENVHRAMLARGFHGHFHMLEPSRFHWEDAVFLAGSAAGFLFLRVAAGL